MRNRSIRTDDGISSIDYRDRDTGWLLLLPALIPLLLVFVYPIGRAFWLSLFTKNLGTKLQPVFAGLANYNANGR